MSSRRRLFNCILEPHVNCLPPIPVSCDPRFPFTYDLWWSLGLLARQREEGPFSSTCVMLLQLTTIPSFAEPDFDWVRVLVSFKAPVSSEGYRWRPESPPVFHVAVFYVASRERPAVPFTAVFVLRCWPLYFAWAGHSKSPPPFMFATFVYDV